MEDGFKPLNCDDDDVLSFGDATFKVAKFRKAVNQSFDSEVGRKFTEQLISQKVNIAPHTLHHSGYWEACKSWFNDGIDCEILNLGSKSWKKGKVRIKFSVEFYVEEQEAVETPSSDKPEISPPESPLDDLRQMMKENTQQEIYE